MGGRRFRNQDDFDMSVTRDFKEIPVVQQMPATNLYGGAILYSGGKKKKFPSKMKKEKMEVDEDLMSVDSESSDHEKKIEGGKKHKPKTHKTVKAKKTMSPAQNSYREQIKKIMATGKSLKEALIWYKNNKK